MDLRALKSSDKKAKSSSFQNFPCKIPIPVRSPTRAKIKPLVTNTIVCSTPLNAAKRNIFDDDNQQMSPIRSTSSATTLEGVSPLKLVDEKELEKKLEISKIPEKKSQVKAQDSVPSKKEIEESVYPFPLVNNIQFLKMIVCDSEDETFKNSLRNTRRKRSKKTVTSDTELMQKSRKKSEVTHNISRKNTRMTRSNTETTNKINVTSNQNIPEKKDYKSSRKKASRSISTSLPECNKVDQNEFLSNVELENSAIVLETVQKINKDILNDKTKKSFKLINNNNENKIVESDFDKILRSKSNEKNVIVDTNSVPKSSSKNKKTKKDILNGQVANTNQANVQILKVSTSTKTAVVIHKNNMFKNVTTNSNIKEDNTNNTKSSESTKRKEIETVNSEEIEESNDNSNHALFSEPKKRGQIETMNSNVIGNNNDVSNTIKVHKNKIFENKTTDSKIEQTLDNSKDGKSSEPKKRGRKPRTMKSKGTENNLRKSARERKSGYTKYWQIDKQEKKLKISKNKSMRPVEKLTHLKKISGTSKPLEISQINEPPKIEEIICNNPEEIKTTEVQEDKKISTKRKSKESKFLTTRKIKSLSSNRLSKSPRKTVIKPNKLQLTESDSSYATEEEYEISGDARKSLSNPLSELPKKTVKKQHKLQLTEKNTRYTIEEKYKIPEDSLVSHITKKVTEKELPRENGQKRKIEINPEITESKKVRLKPNSSENGFKNLAIAANISTQVAGLADVHISGNRCLLECFGKFPRQYTTISQNPDISLGISINNGQITTGVIQIVPLGRKNYEYAKKVDLLFLVLEGIAEVGIGNSSQVLRIGQNCYVPRDTAYYILNVSSTDTLVLYFSKIHKKT